MDHLLAGFGIGFALIAAIGAQNAFVLRQGIRREHVLPIVLVCAASDALLIAAGVAGVGTVIERFPAVLVVVTWVGAAFLVVYGLFAARRMISERSMVAATDGGAVSLGRVLAVCLAFTWLNPHVYLDTVLLVGSIANGQGDGRWAFAAGAMAASAIWFAALGFGARLLSGVFERPVAWRVLDGAVATMMLALGLALVTPAPLGMLLIATAFATASVAAITHFVSRRKTPVGMGTGARCGEVRAL